MYNAIIYYAKDRKQYNVIIGTYDSFLEAEKSGYKYMKEHDTETSLLYFQVLEA